MPILRNATVPSHLVKQEQIPILVYFHEKAVRGDDKGWDAVGGYKIILRHKIYKKREASKRATTKTKAKDETHHQVSSRNAL